MKILFDTKLLIALTVYITAIFMSNLLWLKTIPFLFGTHLSVAVFSLPFIFVTTDIIGKVYGKEMAKKFVLLGFSALILWTLFSLLVQILPWSDRTFARLWEAYEVIFTLSIRVAIASLCAFILSEYLDVLVFFHFKNEKRSFCFSLLASNIVSQAIDTGVFMFIAFWWVFPPVTILMMALPWWISKFSMGIIYMPFSYLALSYFSEKGKHPSREVG